MASVSQRLFLFALAIAAPASHAQDKFTLADYKDAQASNLDGTCVGKECLLRTDAQDGEVLLQSGLRARLGSSEATYNGALEHSVMQTKAKSDEAKAQKDAKAAKAEAKKNAPSPANKAKEEVKPPKEKLKTIAEAPNEQAKSRAEWDAWSKAQIASSKISDPKKPAEDAKAAVDDLKTASLVSARGETKAKGPTEAAMGATGAPKTEVAAMKKAKEEAKKSKAQKDELPICSSSHEQELLKAFSDMNDTCKTSVALAIANKVVLEDQYEELCPCIVQISSDSAKSLEGCRLTDTCNCAATTAWEFCQQDHTACNQCVLDFENADGCKAILSYDIDKTKELARARPDCQHCVKEVIAHCQVPVPDCVATCTRVPYSCDEYCDMAKGCAASCPIELKDVGAKIFKCGTSYKESCGVEVVDDAKVPVPDCTATCPHEPSNCDEYCEMAKGCAASCSIELKDVGAKIFKCGTSYKESCGVEVAFTQTLDTKEAEKDAKAAKAKAQKAAPLPKKEEEIKATFGKKAPTEKKKEVYDENKGPKPKDMKEVYDENKGQKPKDMKEVYDKNKGPKTEDKKQTVGLVSARGETKKKAPTEAAMGATSPAKTEAS